MCAKSSVSRITELELSQSASRASIHYASRLVWVRFYVCNRAGACGMSKLLLLCKRARCGCQSASERRSPLISHTRNQTGNECPPPHQLRLAPQRHIICMCAMEFGVHANTPIELMLNNEHQSYYSADWNICGWNSQPDYLFILDTSKFKFSENSW